MSQHIFMGIKTQMQVKTVCTYLCRIFWNITGIEVISDCSIAADKNNDSELTNNTTPDVMR
jgi:hypothetical protein